MIDLDAKRAEREAARREAEKVGPVIKFGGISYELPAELPYGTLEALRGINNEETAPAAMSDLVRALLGKQYEAFLASSPSIEDVNELVGGLMTEYGVSSPLDSSGS